MNITEDIFKSKPILKFHDDKRIYLSFGLKKAKLIIENIDRIKEFVEKNVSLPKNS